LRPYWVYAKTDAEGRIKDINSDAFLPDTDGWVKIDEGYGDKYYHAQNNYFDKPIMDERGIYRYKLVDGKPVERTQEEMDADYAPPVPAPTAEDRMVEIEKALIELAALMGG
jgi:hypothetical protein